VARSHYRGTIYGDQAAGVKPLAGAAVRLFDPATGNPWPYPVYPDAVNGAPYTVPVLTDGAGTLDLWADAPARVAITITHPSYRGSAGVIDIEMDPTVPGPTGATGPQGETGETGPRGSLWFSASGEPADDLAGAIDKDHYLDVVTGDVWIYEDLAGSPYGEGPYGEGPYGGVG
jgi:hypothetical protein